MRYAAAVFVFLSISLSFSAQPKNQYTFRHIDQTNGLLHNSVYTIAQDKQGFMWMATKNGLQRYDGLRFTSYQKELSPLSYSALIMNLHSGGKEDIWFYTTELAKLNTATNRLTIYDSTLLKNPAFGFEIYTDAYKRRWLAGRYGVYYTDTVSKKLKQLSPGLPTNTSKNGNAVFYDSLTKNIWAANSEGLLLFDYKSKRVYSHDYNPENIPVLQQVSQTKISCFLPGKDGAFWISTWEGDLFKFDPLIKKIKKYALQNERTVSAGDGVKSAVTCMYQDSKGVVWIGTDNKGLFRYNTNDDRFQLITSTANNDQGIPFNYSFFCITEDREGNLWLGTDKGITVFNPYLQYFQTITHRQNDVASLPKSEINALFEAGDGDVYIGTWGDGFTIYDSELNFKKTIKPTGTYELPLIWCFAQGDDGIIWVAAQHGYIHLYNPAIGSYKTIHPPQMENSTIRCMKKDSDGTIWFGMNNGKIAKWEKATGRFFSSAGNSSVQNTFPVLNLFIDGKNRCWASTDFGLLQFDRERLQYMARYQVSSGRTSPSLLRGIEEINDSTLALGTMRTGCVFFNTTKRTFTQPFSLLLLQWANVYAIKKDREGNLWLSTDYQIHQLRVKNETLVSYKLEPGFLNASFELLNFYSLKNGNLVTSSFTEAVVFNPIALRTASHQKKGVTITGIKVFEEALFFDSIRKTGLPLTLRYDQNFITLQYATLSYSGVDERDFFYQLSGLDAHWVKGNEKGFANYTNLAPGEYTFSVKAANADDTILPATFKIIIEPPFYLTWWFKALAVALVAGLTYWFARRRITNIRHEAGLKHRIAEAEINALRSQMNPHFIFNCLNAIDNMIQTNQKEKATLYLSRFAKLIRSVLDSSKNNLVPLYKDVETLKLYLELEAFRTSHKFHYHIDVEPQLLQGDYKVPPLVAQPFLENAIHHGLMNKQTDDRELCIGISLKNSAIVYRIKDNGVGRLKAAQLKKVNRPEHQSYGIQISTDRVKMHNGKDKHPSVIITDVFEEQKPAGTLVELFIRTE